MATRTWNKDRAGKRIDAKIEDLPLKDIEIKEYVRDTDLGNLPSTVAYRVDGVHLYADILNLKDMLHVTDIEGEVCHRRTLRFLNLHYRAVHRILQRVDAMLVDFHNQRLHSVVAKPYDSEEKRVHRAVAIGQLIIDVLARTGEDADHPAAKVRVGIDTGIALAVNNGRRGHREPLFLGEPANHAAKRSGGGTATGIFLTNKARKVISLKDAANVHHQDFIVACLRRQKKLINNDTNLIEEALPLSIEISRQVSVERPSSRERIVAGIHRFCFKPLVHVELGNQINTRSLDLVALGTWNQGDGKGPELT